MTQVNDEHLKPIRVICNTEAEMRCVKTFFDNSKIVNAMIPFVPEEDDIFDFVPKDELNYVVADFGNSKFVSDALERFKDLKRDIKILDMN